VSVFWNMMTDEQRRDGLKTAHSILSGESELAGPTCSSATFWADGWCRLYQNVCWVTSKHSLAHKTGIRYGKAMKRWIKERTNNEVSESARKSPTT
jgi:hypothetical protein